MIYMRVKDRLKKYFSFAVVFTVVMINIPAGAMAADGTDKTLETERPAYIGILGVFKGIVSAVENAYGSYDPTVYENVIYGNEDVTLEIPDGPIAQAEIFIPTYIPIEEHIDIDKETRDFEELTEYLEENVDIFDRDSFKIDEEKISKTRDNYFISYYYTVNGFMTTHNIGVHCENNIPTEYSINLPDNMIDFYSGRTISADDIPDTVIDEAKAEALKDINEGEYKGLRIISQTVTPRIYEDGYKYLRVRTIFEYEDDGEVYQSPHIFEYRLPDKWQG